MRFRPVYQTLCAVWLWAALCTAHAETLVVLGDDAYMPVVFADHGKPAGLLPAILQRIAILTGDHYEVHLSPWKRAYELAVHAEGGVVGISHNQERGRIFDFSKPIYDDDIQIVTLKNQTFPYTTLEDLKGKTIGGVIGASYGEAVDKAIAAGLFSVERDVGSAGRLRKLLAGRLDAAFIGNGAAGFANVVSSQEELRSNHAEFAVLPTPLTRDPLYLAFAKSMHKRAALDRFDAALEKLRKSGELKKLASTSK